MAGNKSSKNQTAASSSLADLVTLVGGGSSLDPALCDGRLFWMAAVHVLRGGATLSLGMNQAKTSLVITLFDGQYPFKQYCESVERANFILGSIARAYGKRAITADEDRVLREYNV